MVEFFDGGRQMTHPDYIVPPEEADGLRRVEPVYPLTGGLSLKTLGRAAQAALDRATELPEWLDREHLKRKNWPAWHAALLQAHAPESAADLSPLMPARERSEEHTSDLQSLMRHS